jgi:hypothetical protein
MRNKRRGKHFLLIFEYPIVRKSYFGSTAPSELVEEPDKELEKKIPTAHSHDGDDTINIVPEVVDLGYKCYFFFFSKPLFT